MALTYRFIVFRILFVHALTAQKIKFSIKDFLSKCDHTADLVTFTE